MRKLTSSHVIWFSNKGVRAEPAFVAMSCHLYSKRGILLPGKVDLPQLPPCPQIISLFVPHWIHSLSGVSRVSWHFGRRSCWKSGLRPTSQIKAVQSPRLGSVWGASLSWDMYRAGKSLCLWFGKFCSCCCLPPLPQLACSILPTTYKEFFPALYMSQDNEAPHTDPDHGD